MEVQEIKTQLQSELPQLLRQDRTFRDWLEQLIRDNAVPHEAFDARFDRIMDELAKDRAERRQEREEDRLEREEQTRKWEAQNRKWEEQNRKWDEHNRNSDRKWEEQNRKWEEQNRKWELNNRKWDEQNRKWDEQSRRSDEMLAEIKASRLRYEQQYGAMGARWGVATEESFRSALKGILEQSFGVEVLNINDFDEEGTVFGAPDQVELDIIIRNGEVIACELKSSMSKGDMYIFDRKVSYYARHHQRPVTRRIVISPMVSPNGKKAAEKLGIEVFTYAEDTTGLSTN